MVGRVKFQVFGKHGWVTAYCKRELLWKNINLMVQHGVRVRVNEMRVAA